MGVLEVVIVLLNSKQGGELKEESRIMKNATIQVEKESSESFDLCSTFIRF